MSGSVPQTSGIATKPSNNTPFSSLPTLSSGNSSFAVEHRRNGGGDANSGSSAIRNSQATPRNNQSSRKNHKNHRKPNTPRLDFDDQVAMVSNSGSRRGTSITHLMNWNIAPRPQSVLDHRIRNYRRYPAWGGCLPADKARYVNSNYRFIVNPKGDYRAQAIDSDASIPWDMVLQVIASEKSQSVNCPICLGHPAAPRMAKCGHMFCLPCVMRYIASTDEGDNKNPASEKRPKYKQCPICWDSVYMNEVRPVRWFAGQEGEAPREGGDVVLRLVKRRQGSTLTLPKDEARSPVEADDIPWHFVAEVADYARIMKGTTDYMIGSFKQEIQDLQVMEKEDELMFNDEGEWTRKAITTIYNQIEFLLGDGKLDPPPQKLLRFVEPAPEIERSENPEILPRENSKQVPNMYHMMHAAKSSKSAVSALEGKAIQESVGQKPDSSLRSPLSSVPSQADIPAESKDTKSMPYGTDVSQSAQSYYFYRALPHYYLAPLDIRILRTAFGSYSSFPSTVLPRVENISRHTVDDDFRKRSKYLAHLPSGCEVAFLECDWADIVSPQILETFQNEVEKRRRRKRDKEAKEERDRLRGEREEEEERWRQKRRESLSPGVSSAHYHQSLLTEEGFVALSIAESQVAPGTTVAEVPVANPGQLAASPPSSIAPGQRTVWGTPVVQSPSLPLANSPPPQEAGWFDGRDNDDLLIQEDLLAHHTLDDYVSRTLGRSPMGSGKASGKKKKKFTLISNGGRRGA